MGDYRTDLDYWVGVWEEFEKTTPASKPINQPSLQSADNDFNPDYLDSASTNQSSQNIDNDFYHDYLDTEQESLIQEGKTANPVYPDSIGKDQDRPKPSWVNEDLLKEIESLKNKLFDLENKMARLGQGKTAPKKPKSDKQVDLMREIESLRKRIDKVSDNLGMEDEPEISMRKIP